MGLDYKSKEWVKAYLLTITLHLKAKPTIDGWSLSSFNLKERGKLNS